MRIGNISFSYMPKPTFTLSDLRLGNDAASIGSVTIPVSITNVTRFRHELSDVSINDAILSSEFALALPQHLKPNPGGRDVHFSSIRMENVSIQFRKRALGPMSGVLKLNPDGTFDQVVIRDTNGRSELNIKPSGKRFVITANSDNWILPGKYHVLFDSITAHGIADENGVLFDDIHGVVFSSAFIGQAQLFWNNGWKIDGSLETKGMQSEPLTKLFSPVTHTAGRMSATALISFSGDSYDTLFSNQAIRMKFSMSDGHLSNMDLVAPIRSQTGAIQRGGITRFELLSGELLWLDGRITLKGLSLTSGKFSANGSVHITNDAIEGRLDSRLQAGIQSIQSNLSINGKLESPEIRSVGTARFGPHTEAERIN
ncbi:hypothetical protein KSF73_00155 [Burkholderiaceae bacterium DAT-1]|nr:hypothetical protein [Burkholderiaceae bacterium DAT-1]